MTAIDLSSLPHTWLIDVDGTIVKHNGHKSGGDRLLPGVLEFWESLPEQDTIILLSARTYDETSTTLAYLEAQGLRYDHVIFGLPPGERILINDMKPLGLSTAIALNLERDHGLAGLDININPAL